MYLKNIKSIKGSIWFLFLKTTIDNSFLKQIEHYFDILLNLVFSMFFFLFLFFLEKKLETKVLSIFFLYLIIENCF